MRFKIVETVLTSELISKLKMKQIEIMNDYDLENHLNKKIIFAKIGEEIISVAFLINNKDYNLSQELENSLSWIYEGDDIQYLRNEIIQKLKDGVTLKAIQSFQNGTNAGTMIVDKLKQSYNSILLYASVSAEEYWEKQNFEHIGDYNYIYCK